MAYRGTPISQQTGGWPDLKPGEIKVTLLEGGTEVLFSVGRRRGTKHTVLNETEAIAAWVGLDQAFGISEKVKKAKVLQARQAKKVA